MVKELFPDSQSRDIATSVLTDRPRNSGGSGGRYFLGTTLVLSELRGTVEVTRAAFVKTF